MKVQNVLFFCLALWLGMGFANNCAQFNPNNFNICAACAQKYYLASGKCVLCNDTTSTLPDCLPKTISSENNQSKISSTNASTNSTLITLSKTEQTTTNTSSNDSIKNKTGEVNTIKSGNGANNTWGINKSGLTSLNTKYPTAEVNSTASNSTTNKINGTNNTPQKISLTNNSQTSSVTQKPSSLSLVQLLAQTDLVNCAQFAITSEGIVCLACKVNFTLNLNKSCVPCPSSESKNSTSQKSTINSSANVISTQTTNNTLNDFNKTAQLVNSSINNAKIISKNSTNTVDTKPILQTIGVPNKTSNSQTHTFIPPITINNNSQTNPTASTNSQSAPTTVQNSIYSSVGLFYSLPSANNIINNGNSQSNATFVPTNTSNTNQQTTSQQIVRYPIPNRPTDPNCLQINPAYSLLQPISAQNKRCFKCYTSFYYNIGQQICSQINPMCKTADDQNNCLSCYPGYGLINGDCVIGTGQQSLSGILVTSNSPSSSIQTSYFLDPNCNKCAPNTNQCILCAVNYYLYNGICKQVNPLCRTYDLNNGNCQSCYQGYTLNTTTQPSSCSISSITDCKTYDSTSDNCLTCYTGYYLSDGTCKQISTIQDPYCNQAGPQGCLQCIQRYYPNQNGVCQMVSLLCANYNLTNGVCVQCILLYTLINGQCVYQQ